MKSTKRTKNVCLREADPRLLCSAIVGTRGGILVLSLLHGMRRRAPPAVVVLGQGGANQVHRWRAAAPASIFNCDNFDQGGLNPHVRRAPRLTTHTSHLESTTNSSIPGEGIIQPPKEQITNPPAANRSS